MSDSSPAYLRIAEVVCAHGKILTSELAKLFGGGDIHHGSIAPSGLADAERAGLIRQDGSERGPNFTSDYYWVPGRNDLSLSIRSTQLSSLRAAADQLAVNLLRRHYAAIRETFLNSGGIIAELEEWVYEDASVTHDEWQLARDAERLHQTVPSPEPPKPGPKPTRVPPKPKPWVRKD